MGTEVGEGGRPDAEGPAGEDHEQHDDAGHEHDKHRHRHHLHAERLAISFENVEELFAPHERPDDIEYGAQPPG